MGRLWRAWQRFTDHWYGVLVAVALFLGIGFYALTWAVYGIDKANWLDMVWTCEDFVDYETPRADAQQELEDEIGDGDRQSERKLDPDGNVEACDHPGNALSAVEEKEDDLSGGDIGGGTDDSGECHASYEGDCLDPSAYDYDCSSGSGDGPEYADGPIDVVGPDDYGLDRDGDGVACEY